MPIDEQEEQSARRMQTEDTVDNLHIITFVWKWSMDNGDTKTTEEDVGFNNKMLRLATSDDCTSKVSGYEKKGYKNIGRNGREQSMLLNQENGGTSESTDK